MYAPLIHLLLHHRDLLSWERDVGGDVSDVRFQKYSLYMQLYIHSPCKVEIQPDSLCELEEGNIQALIAYTYVRYKCLL